MSNLDEAKAFAKSLPYPVDVSKLDGSEVTVFQVAEKVLSLPDLIDWAEKEKVSHLKLVKQYNPDKYDEFLKAAEEELNKLRARL